MFGTINNIQDISSNNNYTGFLLNNPVFIGAPNNIDEDTLYTLIKDAYEQKTKKILEQYCNLYKYYGYTKYLELIVRYLDEIK